MNFIKCLKYSIILIDTLDEIISILLIIYFTIIIDKSVYYLYFLLAIQFVLFSIYYFLSVFKYKYHNRIIILCKIICYPISMCFAFGLDIEEKHYSFNSFFGILAFVLGYSLGICIVFIEPVYLFIKCYDNNESYHKCIETAKKVTKVLIIIADTVLVISSIPSVIFELYDTFTYQISRFIIISIFLLLHIILFIGYFVTSIKAKYQKRPLIILKCLIWPLPVLFVFIVDYKVTIIDVWFVFGVIRFFSNAVSILGELLLLILSYEGNKRKTILDFQYLENNTPITPVTISSDAAPTIENVKTNQEFYDKI